MYLEIATHVYSTRLKHGRKKDFILWATYMVLTTQFWISKIFYSVHSWTRDPWLTFFPPWLNVYGSCDAGLNFKDLRLHTLINQRLVTPVLHRSVCVCVCIWVSVCACVCERDCVVSEYIYACVDICTQVYIYTHVFACVCIWVCVYVCTRARACVGIWACMHVHTHTYT